MTKSSKKGGSKHTKPKKRKTTTKKTKKNNIYQKLKSSGLLIILSILGIIGAIILLIIWLPPPAGKPPKVRPPFEEKPPLLPPPQVGPKKPAPSIIYKPRVAIIIDDLGYNRDIDDAFLHLHAPLCFAFLPKAPYTKFLANEAHKIGGHDILVHIPMQPFNPAINTGPGELRTDMDLDTLLAILKDDLNSVPWAIGANNHMGSKFTTEKKVMTWVLEEIKRRNMFFIDSRTTAFSVAYETAKELGVPTAKRDVFLDRNPNPKAIRKQLKRLIKIAKEKGYAIAIGHPFLITWKVLYRELPWLEKQVKIVPVHELVSSNKERG